VILRIMSQYRTFYVCLTLDNDWYTKGSGPLLAYRSKEEALNAMEMHDAPKVRKFTLDAENKLVEVEDFYPKEK